MPFWVSAFFQFRLTFDFQIHTKSEDSDSKDYPTDSNRPKIVHNVL